MVTDTMPGIIRHPGQLTGDSNLLPAIPIGEPDLRVREDPRSGVAVPELLQLLVNLLVHALDLGPGNPSPLRVQKVTWRR